jgi:elongation factor Ts
MISIDQIKQLRDETGVSISECKKALEETGGNIVQAKEILRKLGKELSSKKTERETKQGIIDSYIHPNKKIGVLLDLRCESDFVAKNEEFKTLSHELCLQIAAMNPLFLKTDDIPEEFLSGEREIYQEQFKNSGKPQKLIKEIIEGKLKKYRESISLLSQLWIKDESKTVNDLICDYISRLGENIIVKKFIRYEI